MKFLSRLFVLVSLLFPLVTLAAAPLSEGTVKKVDASSQRITVDHGPLENLGMGPMTMMFKVKDPAMLKQVKTGDKVRFRVEVIDGTYTVVHIEAAR